MQVMCPVRSFPSAPSLGPLPRGGGSCTGQRRPRAIGSLLPGAQRSAGRGGWSMAPWFWWCFRCAAWTGRAGSRGNRADRCEKIEFSAIPQMTCRLWLTGTDRLWPVLIDYHYRLWLDHYCNIKPHYFSTTIIDSQYVLPLTAITLAIIIIIIVAPLLSIIISDVFTIISSYFTIFPPEFHYHHYFITSINPYYPLFLLLSLLIHQ